MGAKWRVGRNLKPFPGPSFKFFQLTATRQHSHAFHSREPQAMKATLPQVGVDSVPGVQEGTTKSFKPWLLINSWNNAPTTKGPHFFKPHPLCLEMSRAGIKMPLACAVSLFSYTSLSCHGPLKALQASLSWRSKCLLGFCMCALGTASRTLPRCLSLHR